MDYCDRDNRYVSIRIDLAAIKHNLHRARAAAPGKKIFSVVKSDAYGHGAERIVTALRDSDGFAVANVAEALAVRRIVNDKPILVLQGFHSPRQLRDCVRLDLWPVVHYTEQLQMLDKTQMPQKARTLNKEPGPGCWLKFDTGMGRLGFKPEQAADVFARLQKTSATVQGVLTHFASADSPRDMSTDRQLKVFRSLRLPESLPQSAANSAALLSRADSHYDWVRPGIMLYGANPFQIDGVTNANLNIPTAVSAQSEDSANADLGLQPAMRVTAPVISIRDFNRGDRIGYGGTYECSAPTRVAVVGAGYGDGYPRVISAGTDVMLGNRRCPVLGRVSMDSMSVDVSELSVPPPIDFPVTLWGHARLLVDEIADRAGTIPYELLCTIRGKRRWLDPSPETNIRNIKDELSS